VGAVPDPLSLVTIHHEGAGDPIEEARGGDGGYTYWIGITKFTRLRSPFESFATLHFNHKSVDICLSGNRENAPVTDNDIVLIAQAVADARARGELTDKPTVRQHKETFNTSCPGQHTVDRWDDILAQLRDDHFIDLTEDDVRLEIVIPDEPMTDGEFVGKRPAVVHMIGTPMAFHLNAEQQDIYLHANVPMRTAPLSEFGALAIHPTFGE
jgi:hypothetical protein